MRRSLSLSANQLLMCSPRHATVVALEDSEVFEFKDFGEKLGSTQQVCVSLCAGFDPNCMLETPSEYSVSIWLYSAGVSSVQFGSKTTTLCKRCTLERSFYVYAAVRAQSTSGTRTEGRIDDDHTRIPQIIPFVQGCV